MGVGGGRSDLGDLVTGGGRRADAQAGEMPLLAAIAGRLARAVMQDTNDAKNRAPRRGA